MISILKTQELKYQNLCNVQRLVNLFGTAPEKLDLLFIRNGSKYLLDEYKSFNAYEKKVMSNIVATCKAALNLLNDEAIRRVTSFDTIDMDAFRKRKCCLFLQNNIAFQKYHSGLTSMFFEQFFAYLMSRLPEEGEQDIFLLMDEAAGLRLPTLALACTNLRKYRSGLLIAIQSFSQLFENFGRHDAETIRSNCFSKMYFTGSSLETSQELEATLGRFEFEDEAGHRRIMPLLSSDAIRTMDPSRALLICGHHPPMYLKLKPHFKNRTFLKYSLLPVPPIETHIPCDEVLLLPLEQINSQQ